jgi:hypothetical protein
MGWGLLLYSLEGIIPLVAYYKHGMGDRIHGRIRCLVGRSLSNMKELRGKVQGKERENFLRVLFAFDPRRTALLLLGGDKTGDPKWYDKFVPIADALFDQHLQDLERERQKNQ